MNSEHHETAITAEQNVVQSNPAIMNLMGLAKNFVEAEICWGEIGPNRPQMSKKNSPAHYQHPWQHHATFRKRIDVQLHCVYSNNIRTNAYVLFTCRCAKKCNPKHIAVEQGVSTELITRRQLLGRLKPPLSLVAGEVPLPHLLTWAGKLGPLAFHLCLR